MDFKIRRSARSARRHRRLDRAHPDFRDALLRSARDGKYAGLSVTCGKPARAEHRGRSGSRPYELVAGSRTDKVCNVILDRRDEFRPALPACLPIDPHARVPRAVAAILKPVPEPPLAVGYEQEHRLAKRAGKMRRCIAHRDYRVARGDQRREPVDVVRRVDVVEMYEFYAVARKACAFLTSFAVLKIDKAHARKSQDRFEVGELRAFVGAPNFVKAPPRKAEDFTTVTGKA